MWEHEVDIQANLGDENVISGKSKKGSNDNIIWTAITDSDFNIKSFKCESKDEEFLTSLKKRIRSLRLPDLFE